MAVLLDIDRIDPSGPIKSWRSAWRAALRRAGLQIRFHDLRQHADSQIMPTFYQVQRLDGAGPYFDSA
jgi:hypothetical protein